MGLGITGASSNVQGPSQPANTANISRLNDAIKDFMAEVMVIDVNEADEAAAAVRTGKEVGQKGVAESQSQQVQQQKNQDQIVQFKPQQEATMNDANKPDPQLAALAALFADDDELDIRKKKKKSALEKKLEQLQEMEGLLSELECNDPENQAELEAFLENMQTLKKRQSDLRRLNQDIERLEEQLEKQDASDQQLKEAQDATQEKQDSIQSDKTTSPKKKNFNKIAENTGQIPFPVTPVDLEELE